MIRQAEAVVAPSPVLRLRGLDVGVGRSSLTTEASSKYRRGAPPEHRHRTTQAERRRGRVVDRAIPARPARSTDIDQLGWRTSEVELLGAAGLAVGGAVPWGKAAPSARVGSISSA